MYTDGCHLHTSPPTFGRPSWCKSSTPMQIITIKPPPDALKSLRTRLLSICERWSQVHWVGSGVKLHMRCGPFPWSWLRGCSRNSRLLRCRIVGGNSSPISVQTVVVYAVRYNATPFHTVNTSPFVACPKVVVTTYSMSREMIVPLPGFFCPRMIVRWTARLEIEAQSQIFSHQTIYIKRFFWHRNFRGHFEVFVVFYPKSHTYTYSVNDQRTLISPKLKHG